MIQKLRRQFILVAMCSTLAVLTVIIGTMNIIYYRNIIRNADALLLMLGENDGRFPDHTHTSKKQILIGIEQLNEKGSRVEINPETPFETRYFSVCFTKEKEVETVDTGKITAVLTKDAIEYAKQVLMTGKTSGFCKEYRYLLVYSDEKPTVIFVDMGRELKSFRTILYTSVGVSFFGVLTVFLLVLFFSKKVFIPVEESYSKQKQFITDASHELKTPLTIISANVEVLEMESEENDWTISIKKQVQRMVSLVEQMVSLSRMDEEKVVLQKRDFSLSFVMEEICESFAPLAAAKKIEFIKELAPDVMYYGDEKMIRQMISALLDNSMKYGKEEGTVSVSLFRKGKRAEIILWNSVEDIKKGNLDILFERFYRLDESRNSNQGGSGIGLSIVKSIVDAHKGKISAHSTDGKSIKFHILLS